MVTNEMIPGFVYAIRMCPYCEQELELVNVVHVQSVKENYKAIMICFNDRCPYYDGPCREAFVKVYYSSQLAADILGTVRLRFARPRKGEVHYDEIMDPMEGISGVYFHDEECI